MKVTHIQKVGFEINKNYFVCYNKYSIFTIDCYNKFLYFYKVCYNKFLFLDALCTFLYIILLVCIFQCFMNAQKSAT